MFSAASADIGTALAGHYNFWLLLLPALLVSFVTCIAFSIAARVQNTRLTSVWAWRSWWLMGSLILGICIWSAHFIGMMAYRLPVPVHYNLKLSLLSLVPALLASGLLLKIDPGSRPDRAYQWLIATAMGAGIVLMHYLGTAAMRMNALIIYDAIWLTASILITIALCYVVLWFKCKLPPAGRDRVAGFRYLLALSVVMGVLIVAINCFSVFASQFIASPYEQIFSVDLSISSQVFTLAAMGTVAAILTLLFAAVQFGYRMDLAAMVQEENAFTLGILETSMEAIISIDSTGLIKGFNRAAEGIFKYAASSVIDKNVKILLPEKTGKLLDENLAVYSSNAGQYVHQTHELTGVRSDGTEFPMEFCIGPVMGHGTAVFVGAIRDISARHEAESDWQKDEDRLELLLTASPIVIYTCATTGSLPINYVSPNSQDIFGFDPKAITATPGFWPDRIHPDDKNSVDMERKTLRREGHNRREYRVRLNDDTYRWVSDTQTMICDQDGNPTLLVGSWTDIHDKKVAELNLAIHEERLRISLKRNNMATWDWILLSGDFNWSDSIPEILGLSADQNEGFDGFISTVHSEDKADVQAAFRKSLVSGHSFDEEYRVVWPDRSVRWVHSIGGLINDEQGCPLHMVGVLTDITETKQLRVAPALSVNMR